jgi:hypothetical protein
VKLVQESELILQPVLAHNIIIQHLMLLVWNVITLVEIVTTRAILVFPAQITLTENYKVMNVFVKMDFSIRVKLCVILVGLNV